MTEVAAQPETPKVVAEPPPPAVAGSVAEDDTLLADVAAALGLSDAPEAPAESPVDTAPPAPAGDGYIDRSAADLQREIEALFQAADMEEPALPQRSNVLGTPPAGPKAPTEQLAPADGEVNLQTPEELAASIEAVLNGAMPLSEKETSRPDEAEDFARPGESETSDDFAAPNPETPHDDDLQSKLSEAEDVLQQELAALANDAAGNPENAATSSAPVEGSLDQPNEQGTAADAAATTSPDCETTAAPRTGLSRWLLLPTDLLLMTAQAADIPFAQMDVFYKNFMAIAATIMIASGIGLCAFSWWHAH